MCKIGQKKGLRRVLELFTQQELGRLWYKVQKKWCYKDCACRRGEMVEGAGKCEGVAVVCERV